MHACACRFRLHLALVKTIKKSISARPAAHLLDEGINQTIDRAQPHQLAIYKLSSGLYDIIASCPFITHLLVLPP